MANHRERPGFSGHRAAGQLPNADSALGSYPVFVLFTGAHIGQFCAWSGACTILRSGQARRSGKGAADAAGVVSQSAPAPGAAGVQEVAAGTGAGREISRQEPSDPRKACRAAIQR